MDFRVQIWGMIKALNLRTIEALKSICPRLITLARCTLKMLQNIPHPMNCFNRNLLLSAKSSKTIPGNHMGLGRN